MSLRTLLLAAFAYVLVLVLLAVGIPFGSNLSRRVDAEVKAQAAGQTGLIAATAAGGLGDRADLERTVRRAAAQVRGRVIAVDARGRLAADSAGDGLRSSSYASRPEIARALRGETAQGTRYSASVGEEILYTAVPVVRSGRTEGAVRTTQSIEAVRAAVRRSLVELAAVGLAAVALGLAAAWLMAGWLSRPVRGLAAAARRISGGELGHRAEPAGSREQRELTEAFNDMTERLGRSLAAQREFVADASHQLRTPLTGLRLRLESAGLRAEDRALRTDLEAAEAEAVRLSALLDDLLTLAEATDRDRRAASASLASVARAAHERWSGRVTESGHVLRLDGAEGPRAAAAEGDLAVILDHLVENAINYSPTGTTVALAWSEAGGEVELAVCDEGPGLPEEDRARAFDRFYRGGAGPDRPPGTGLGLSIVESLARRWGGRARIEARPGGGAAARVTLPRADGAAAPAESASADARRSGPAAGPDPEEAPDAPALSGRG